MTARHAFALAVLAAVSSLSVAALAQTYPLRPVIMIVPTTAGTSADTVGRVVAERMRQSLGQPVIIENVSGADGTIGVAPAARAPPDGYTIHIGYKATKHFGCGMRASGRRSAGRSRDTRAPLPPWRLARSTAARS